MRKLIRFLLILAVLLPLGGTVSAQAREEVRFLIQETDPPSVDAYLDMEAEFEAEFPEYDVVIEFTNPEAISVKIATVIASGGVLDVFQPNPAMGARMAQDGQLLALDDVIENLGGVDEFFPGTLLQVEGSTYAMPYASGGPVLWYRTDLFEEAGLEPPTTWDEWLAAAEALTKGDMYGIAIPGIEGQYTSIIAQALMWSAGTEVFNDDLSVKLAGNERAAEALAFYADLLQYAPPGVTSYSFFEVIDAFTAGQAAMAVYWGRLLGRIYSDAPDLIGKFDAVPLPSKRMPATFADISYNCVYAETEHPEASKAWVEFMARPEQAVKLQLTIPGHLVPVTPGQAEALMASGNVPLTENPHAAEVLFGVNEYGHNVGLNAGGIDEENLTIESTGVISRYLDVLWSGNALSRAVQEVFINDTDPAVALEKAQEELEAAIAESG